MLDIFKKEEDYLITVPINIKITNILIGALNVKRQASKGSRFMWLQQNMVSNRVSETNVQCDGMIFLSKQFLNLQSGRR